MEVKAMAVVAGFLVHHPCSSSLALGCANPPVSPQSAGGTAGCSPPMTPSSATSESRRGSSMGIKRKTKVSVECGANRVALESRTAPWRRPHRLSHGIESHAGSALPCTGFH